MMSAFDQQSSHPNYGVPVQSSQTGFQSGTANGQDPNISPLDSSTYGNMAYFQSTGDTSPSPPRRLDENTLNSLLYEQGLVGAYQGDSSLLQQPQMENPSSASTTMMSSVSPRSMNDHLSPEPFSQDGSDLNLFGQNQINPTLPNSQFGSPMVMSDDGQSTYTTFSYEDAVFAPQVNAMNPNMQNQSINPNQVTSSNFMQQHNNGQDSTRAFIPDARPTNLSLGIPNFGNPYYPQDESHMVTPTNVTGIDMSQPPHLRSPIVRIENYEDLSQQADGLSRNLSKRSSQGSKRSNRHLSPYGNDDISDDGSLTQPHNTISTSPFPSLPLAERNEDGSWVAPAETVRGGISPVDRAAMNNESMFTLDEMEEHRRRAERHADVQEWLSHSSAGSEDEGSGPRRSQYRRKINRPRARSANDVAAMRANQPGIGYLAVPGPPGPGVLLNESSDFDEEDGDPSWPGSDLEDGTPPVDLNSVNNYFANQTNNDVVLDGRPWTDNVKPASQEDMPHQPTTANAAIMAYRVKIKEADTASLAATVGSRRRSVTDLDSLYGEQSRTSTMVDLPQAEKEKKSLFNNIISKIPSRSNSRKRPSDASVTHVPTGISSQEARSPQVTPRRSFVGRPRTPKLDTDVPTATGEGRSPSNVVAGVSAKIAKARNAFRNRSKSDIGKNSAKSPGLTQLLTQHGGVPMLNLASPARPFGRHLQVTPVDADDDSDDGEGDDGEGVSMDLTPRLDMLPIPNRDGFKYHILTLNPNINHQLLERLTVEQERRFTRLSELRKEHDNSIMRQKCSSHCPALGRSPEELPPRTTGRNADAAAVTFRIMTEGMTEQDLEHGGDSQSSIQAAQFPIGVPNPPTHVLPSKFECSYCFKAKEFKKPSDWTKHIHEDVQPFTCTFPDCQEPKSFKRKADWVRHENERHRQLESWICDFEECNHVCHRRDNFVQHLVREHKVPEPKIRTGRNSGSRSPIALDMPLPDDFDRNRETTEEYVRRVVERCLKGSTKDPREESCRFCGNICTSWKKLTVHLAKHMEQIALPVIPLVERYRSAQGVDTSRAFGHAQVQRQTNASNHNMLLSTHTMVAERSAPQTGNAQDMFFDEPSDMNDSGVPTIAVGGTPFLGVDLGPQSLLDPAYAANLPGTSYPPAMLPGNRSRGSSTSEATYNIMRQGTTYPPANIPAAGRGMDGAATNGGTQMMYGFNGQQTQGQQFFQNMNPFGA